jgi:hypothetical protein
MYHNRGAGMNAQTDFEVYTYPVKYQEYGKPIYVIPFGDVHRSSPNCHEEKWLEFCQWARIKKNAYFIGMGDYDDLASGSERILLNNKALHDSTRYTLEDLYRKLTDKFAKELSFMDGRIIGLIEGNHYGEFENGTTTTQRLAEKLKCKYLGSSAFIRLSLSTANKHGGSNSIDIWAHHGLGGARLVGGSLNKVQQMAEIADASIYLMGHDHKKSIGTVSQLGLSNTGHGETSLHHKKKLFCRTGSFLRGYVPGGRSYVAKKMLNPTDLGVVKIEITPKRSKAGGSDITELDLHASL